MKGMHKMHVKHMKHKMHMKPKTHTKVNTDKDMDMDMDMDMSRGKKQDSETDRLEAAGFTELQSKRIIQDEKQKKFGQQQKQMKQDSHLTKAQQKSLKEMEKQN